MDVITFMKETLCMLSSRRATMTIMEGNDTIHGSTAVNLTSAARSGAIGGT